MMRYTTPRLRLFFDLRVASLVCPTRHWDGPNTKKEVVTKLGQWAGAHG